MNAAERLADALHEKGLLDMESMARAGYYGDFTSPLAMPITQLVTDLRARGAKDLVLRAMSGEFDGE
jgi:succinylarginine dihydrolase